MDGDFAAVGVEEILDRVYREEVANCGREDAKMPEGMSEWEFFPEVKDYSC